MREGAGTCTNFYRPLPTGAAEGPQETLKTLVESQSYLSEEESSLKKVLEDSMRQFFESYDEFNQLNFKITST